MQSFEVAFTKNNEVLPYSVVRKFVTDINFVNIGIIRKVHNENYIDVSLYYLEPDGKERVIPDVRLLSIGTTKCKVTIQPSVGDAVLVLTPKDFVPVIEYNRKAEAAEDAYLEYSDINACAVLIKAESDDNVKTEIKVDESGNVTLKTNGDVKADSTDGKIILDGDGYGGLCKTQELKKQLDKATKRIDGIMDALKKSPTGSQDGGAAYKSGISAFLAQLTDKEDYSEIESETVLHGDGPSES